MKNRILSFSKTRLELCMIEQCTASVRELSGPYERSPNIGTKAKPTMVSCDVPYAELKLRGGQQDGEQTQQESKTLLVLQRLMTLS